MAATNAERQAKWCAKRNALARIATALRDYDAALFKQLQKEAERCATKKRIRQKRKGHVAA